MQASLFTVLHHPQFAIKQKKLFSTNDSKHKNWHTKTEKRHHKKNQTVFSVEGPSWTLMQLGNLFSNKTKPLYLNLSGPSHVSKYVNALSLKPSSILSTQNPGIDVWQLDWALSKYATKKISYLRGKHYNWEKNSGHAWRSIQIR